MRIRPLLITLLLTSMSFAQTKPSEHGKFVNLGVQITSTTIQGTTFAKEPDRRDVVCAVIRGEPAKLLVFDVHSGELLHRMPLEGAKGAWNATTASDGSVYAGTDNNGHLYRWVPGESQVHDCGVVAPDQTFAWEAAAGANGEVLIGTYPGCNVIRYHPKDGFSDIGHGAMTKGENYVRGVAYVPASGKIYASIGSHAHLVELDPTTGKKKEILPETYANREFAYAVDVVAGKLIVQLTPNEAIVMNPATREIEATLPNVSGQQVVTAKSPYGDTFYYYGDGGLAEYDLKTRKSRPIDAVGKQQIVGLGWVTIKDDSDFPGPTVVVLARYGNLTWYHPQTGKTKRIKLHVPPESTPIHSIRLGPDGTIYSGGYLSGGLATFDPTTGKHVQVGSISQSEGIGVLGSKLYLGCYPRARLYAFDTNKPWDTKQDNPHQIDSLDRVEQDRPVAVLGVAELKKVFYGTVPDYGKLGGMLAIVDDATYKVDTHRNVVTDQSVVSLAYADGMIVGGSSVSGGLGIEPRASEGKLFLWDPKKNEKVFETSPVAGAKLVTGLIIGPDKNVWGVADGTLFGFDVAKRAVIFTKPLFPPKPSARHAGWRDAAMLLHSDGNIYGTVSDKLFRLDPKSKDVMVLRDDNAQLITMDNDGRLYFKDVAELWQYTP
jgi:WD40 repeat protein